MFVPSLAAADLLICDLFLPLCSCEASATLKSPSTLSVTCVIADKLICYTENYREKLNVIMRQSSQWESTEELRKMFDLEVYSYVDWKLEEG